LGAYIHDAVSAMSDHASQQQQQPGQGHSRQQMQPFYYGQQSPHHELTQQSQPHRLQQTSQQYTQQQCPGLPNDQGIFAQPTLTSPSTGPQLPPLRSIVEMTAGGHNPVQLPQPLPALTTRNMSLASNMSSGSYTSLSSSEGYGGQSLSPREQIHPS